MENSELYDRFVAPGVTYLDVSQMGIVTIERQIAEMRQDEPDNIPLSDTEIAQRIIWYARETYLETTN